MRNRKGSIKILLKKAKNLKKIPDWQSDGYISVFRYHKSSDNIPVYQFEKADREWLWLVSMNRRSHMAGMFKEKLKSDMLNAEIVVGKIADDTTNPTIMAYLNGLYGDVESASAVDFAISQLLPD